MGTLGTTLLLVLGLHQLVTEGIGSVLYGLLRPVCFLAIAAAVFAAPGIRTGRWAMICGALGSAVASIIFLFVHASIVFYDDGRLFGHDGIISNFAELLSTPAIVLFTLGFVASIIEIAGLKFGRK